MSTDQTAEITAGQIRSLLPTGTVAVVAGEPACLRVTLHNGFAFNLPSDFNVNHFDFVLTAILSALNSHAGTNSAAILH